MIKVRNEINVYEVNGQDVYTKFNHKFKLVIESHGTDDKMVILDLENGDRLGVYAKDMIAAIHNVQNTNKY